jgi:uncharacterized Ntn-hydrolase superfamily protein
MALRRSAYALAVVVALVPHQATATYSIVAADRDAGTVGGAVASCVPLEVLERVYGAAPGKGALVTQSYLFDPAHSAGLARLNEGAPPADVIASLTDPAFDPDFARRQYAVVDLGGRVATFTGTQALAYAGDATFERAPFVGSVQGNILTGPEVVESARVAFLSDAGCDLAARLVRALEAGGAEGRGDGRCVATGTPAKSAIVEVDDPSGPVLRIAVESPGDPPVESPLALVRRDFDVWREAHACTSGVADGAASGSSGSSTADADAGAQGCAVAAASATRPGLGGACGLAWALLTLRRGKRKARSPRGAAIDFRGPNCYDAAARSRQSGPPK